MLPADNGYDKQDMITLSSVSSFNQPQEPKEIDEIIHTIRNIRTIVHDGQSIFGPSLAPSAFKSSSTVMKGFQINKSNPVKDGLDIL